MAPGDTRLPDQWRRLELDGVPAGSGDACRTRSPPRDSCSSAAPTFSAFNTVRKHLSQVKGGGLLRQARTRMLALLISDVIGDDPSTIGSGPTAPDDTTFADAWDGVRHATTSPAVCLRASWNWCKTESQGRVPETVKSSTAEAALCRNVIIGSNRTALEGAAAAARARGWTVHIEGPAVEWRHDERQPGSFAAASTATGRGPPRRQTAVRTRRRRDHRAREVGRGRAGATRSSRWQWRPRWPERRHHPECRNGRH